jgi:hypothetical protein
MGARGAGRDVEMFQKRVADQMRRPPGGLTHSDVHTGLAEIHRQNLSVGIRHVQNAHIAATSNVVEIVLRLSMRRTRQHAGRGTGGQQPDEIAAIGLHGAVL